MIRNPVDAAVHVSPELSAYLGRWVNDPDIDQPVTLAEVRSCLSGLLSDSFKESNALHHFDVSDSIMDELDILIGEFGPSAPAIEFYKAYASEALSRVIETVMDDENRENPPTLGEVQEAMSAGLVTRLIGEGVLEEDEDEGLAGEMAAMIGSFGADALAEEYLRYE
jgi:hypothetical protein